VKIDGIQNREKKNLLVSLLKATMSSAQIEIKNVFV
jgi:hypothetical protein